ncbi:MAG: IPT/TIG domain-containing protein [Holophaga sp.]|nr:IPT/TIG domain-containing protein [Holophaga sp.]
MRTLRWLDPVLALSLILAGSLLGCGSQGAAQPPGHPAAPTITSFSASPAAINPGDTAQLTWEVSGATTLAVSSFGAVSGTGTTVAPASTTTYTLIVSNAAGSTRATAEVAVKVGVGVGPRSVVLLAGTSQPFTATVTGSSNTAVTWSVDQPGGGFISATGQYLAPQASGSYTVRATSLADPSVSATAQVTVDLIGVAIAPGNASIITGATTYFTAAVAGASTSSAVTWSVPADSGTVTSTGTNSASYTAPAVAGTYLVRATSSEDPGQYSEAQVTVNQVAVSVAPAAVNLLAGASYQFAARVTGTPTSAVTWSVVSGAGSIDANGLFRAPASGGVCQVQATSQAAPAASGQATVTAYLVGTSISPSAVTLTQGATQQFTAQVTGASGNAGVTWQVAGTAGGSIDADGTYTAGATAGTDYVNVYSREDPGKAATATVTVTPAPSFTLSLPGSVTVQQGGTSTAPITVNPLYGFTGTVAFTAPAIPGTNFHTTCSPAASGSATTLSVTATPNQNPGTYTQGVTGTCGSITFSGTVQVIVTSPQPVITGISPVAGVPAGGTAVTLTGTGLAGVAHVYFGSTEAQLTAVVSSTQVISYSLPATVGTVVDIKVTTGAGDTSAVTPADRFTYMDLCSVATILPTFGPVTGGGTISLMGQFNGVTEVDFGTVPSPSFSFNPFVGLVLNAQVPAQAAGSVPVTVRNAAGPSAVSANTMYTYYALPNVTGITPSSGPAAGGTTVTLTGTGFMGASSVPFGSTAATSFTVVSDTKVTAVTPAGSAGSVAVTVVNPSYTSNGVTFTFVN